MVDPAGTAALPEVPVPANPNCVVWAAEASTVLSGRTWADAIRAISEPAIAFHRACGLPVLAGWSWRVALDRRNHRTVQALMWFVFDGPATSAHLDILEREVHAVFPSAGTGSIERCPVNGAQAVLVRDGVALVPWQVDDTGAAHLLTLEWRDGRMHPQVLPRAAATTDDVPEELASVLGVLPVYGEEEERHERLRLAFAMHYCARVMEADGVVRSDEREFVDNVFPPDLVRRLNLDDLALRAEYLTEAHDVLPGQLGHHDKLGLVGLLFSACYSDGTLDAREMKVLKEAGEALGLTREEVVKYLRRFW